MGVPVFAVDWLLGSLTPFGGYHLEELFKMGGELLTTLAYRQLALGQSAILDFPAEDLATRSRWRSLAGAAGAEFRVVVCVCSDRELHRARLEGRERGIPGWHDAGNYSGSGYHFLIHAMTTMPVIMPNINASQNPGKVISPLPVASAIAVVIGYP